MGFPLPLPAQWKGQPEAELGSAPEHAHPAPSVTGNVHPQILCQLPLPAILSGQNPDELSVIPCVSRKIIPTAPKVDSSAPVYLTEKTGDSWPSESQPLGRLV